VLGRAGEVPGAATLRWDVTRAGRPVLRQVTELSDGAGMLTAGRRVLGCTLMSGPDLAARTVVASPAAVAQRVDEHTVLITVLDGEPVRDASGGARCRPRRGGEYLARADNCLL
jgi:hypothetical protein